MNDDLEVLRKRAEAASIVPGEVTPLHQQLAAIAGVQAAELSRYNLQTADILEAAPEQTMLAIDTSLGTAVAISRGSAVWQLESPDKMAHAEVVGEMMQLAMLWAGVTPADITGVVMGVGPGSFTGLRVGMAAATAFAVGAGAPLLPILSHEAVAFAALQERVAGRAKGQHSVLDSDCETVRVVQDGRRKELFVSSYSLEKASNSAYGLTAQVAIPTELTAPAVVSQHGFKTAAGDIWAVQVAGAALLQLAALRLAKNLPFIAPEPVYLRDPDVRPPAGLPQLSKQ